MSGSTRTVQVTLGIRQMTAAIIALALAIAFAVVLAFGQLMATKPQTAPAAGPSVVTDQGSGSGGSNGTRFPQ
jgi:hypothetical protein